MVREKYVQLEQKKQLAVCFTGPRPAKLPDGGDKKSAAVIEIGRRLEQAVLYHIAGGKTVFLNGCMAGIDVMAGEAVLRLKHSHPEILCATIAPFQKNFFNSENWTPEWKERGLDLYRRSDISFALSPAYYKGVYYQRDKYLVDHSSAVICYYTGTGGGTKYTLRYAQQVRSHICNVAQEENPGGYV